MRPCGCCLKGPQCNTGLAAHSTVGIQSVLRTSNFIHNNGLKAGERLRCQIASFTPRSSSPVFISSEMPPSERCCSSSWNLEENETSIKSNPAVKDSLPAAVVFRQLLSQFKLKAGLGVSRCSRPYLQIICLREGGLLSRRGNNRNVFCLYLAAFSARWERLRGFQKA